MTAGDVIHSWALPCIGIKMDCVPGRLNKVIKTVNMQPKIEEMRPKGAFLQFSVAYFQFFICVSDAYLLTEGGCVLRTVLGAVRRPPRFHADGGRMMKK